MNSLRIILPLTLLVAPLASAYEVWLGLHCTPASAAKNPDQWKLTANTVQGINANLAPAKPSPGTPCENEKACSRQDWKKVIQNFKAKNNVKAEIPRSMFGPRGDHADRSIADALQAKVAEADAYGYQLRMLMFYDNATKGLDFHWTVDEVKTMRKWLDDNGHSKVELMYNARNNGASVRRWCVNPMVDAVMLEANSQKWFDNAGARHELLKWLWSEPKAADKKLFFQIPGSPNPFGTPDNFTSVRRLIHWFGEELMDYEFLRSPRVIFMPVTYNGPTICFYPEIESPTRYANTMTSLAISLIEQKRMFEGRNGKMTTEDVDSYDRKNF